MSPLDIRRTWPGSAGTGAPPVWDRLVRTSHWIIALLWLLDYGWLEAGESAHEWAGYGLLAVLVLRLLWAFVGPANARLANFLPTPARLRAYIRRFPHWSAGHNPLGALMVCFLWLGLLVTGLSGWLQTTDAFWGEEWPQRLHAWAADLVMAAVLVHVVAVLVMGRVYQKPLLRAMIKGR